MTDASLKQIVLDELAWEPAVSEAHIGVTVRDGVVTLSGHVASYAEKCAAAHAVSRVAGVKAIVQEIEIRYLYDVGHGDETIAQQAISVLAWDLSVPRDKVRVEIDRGWVTLSGNVNWYYQKNAAEADVRKLFGVMGVNNQITIEPGVEANEVQSRITAAFERNAEIEASHVLVTAEGSKVTLSGRVDSFYGRTLAENTAWSAPGVTHVTDHLTIG